MKLVTSGEMASIDRATIEGYGIPAMVLMERAGLAVAGRILSDFPMRKALILAGVGNNGGDGLVVARELSNAGLKVQVRLIGDHNRLSPECKAQLEIITRLGIPVSTTFTLMPRDLHSTVIIDAIMGTGLSREITGTAAQIIETVNSSSAPVVAVDIPSGVSSDTGQVMGIAVRAVSTVTFGLPKRGHYLHPGAEHTGRLYVEDIGFPSGLLADNAIRSQLLDRHAMRILIPARPAYSHKGNYGHVLVVGCSEGKTGAGLLAARAALATGAGLVTLGIPESLAPSLYGAVREEMLLPLADDGHGALTTVALDALLQFLETNKKAALAIGPGLGRNPATIELVLKLIGSCAAPMVIDADALYALSNQMTMLRTLRAPAVLTPHPGEFSRLSGNVINQTEQDRIGAAAGFAVETGAHLVLKGTPTVIASPDGSSLVNPLGSPAMAKAGAGDVLTGMIAALMAQGLAPMDASALGVYLHSMSAELSTEKKDVHSVLASDIINDIPLAFRRLLEG